MIKEIIISSMKSKLFMALVLGIFLASCGGGGGSGSNAVTPENAIRQGYAVDDYVIGGTVKIYNGSTDVILNETTTGEKGVFSWPSNISGAIRVEITGGKEDVDGSSSTTDDQKPFDGKLIAVYFADKQAAPVVVSAVTTGLANASKGEIENYETLKAGLPDDIAKNFFIASSDTQSDIDKKLEVVKKVQRTMGMSSIVNELSDDGKINNSNGISASSIASPIALAGSAASSGIEDLALQYCIAEQLGKDPASIKQSDLVSITSLHCEGAGVLSLNGIQSLSNIESLTLNNNEISDVKPLQSLSKLYYINLNNNKIRGLTDFNSAQFSDVSLDIGGNCISDVSTISDTVKIKVSQYAANKRQFPNCVKNDANVKRMVARVSGTGVYVLVYITDLNTLADCQIDWGDGSTEKASCDARSHTVQHAYSSPPKNPVKFLVNGVVKAQAIFPITPIPQPSDSIEMSSSELQKYNADIGSGVQFLTGLNGGKAARFPYQDRGAYIRIPNRQSLQFGSEVTIDFFAKIENKNEFTLSDGKKSSWCVELLAKTENETGMSIVGCSLPDISGTFITNEIMYAGHFEVPNFGSVVNSNKFMLNDWVRITITQSSTGGYKQYMNKVLYLTNPNHATLFNAFNRSDLYIGGGSPANSLGTGAWIQGIKFYNRALTINEILVLP